MSDMISGSLSASCIGAIGNQECSSVVPLTLNIHDTMLTACMYCQLSHVSGRSDNLKCDCVS